ncbi:RABGAP1L [Symbiodinium sp. CCMP2456]|nr:RABGAP1L [Symbiodinium sp. CCMP2456]
MQLKAQLSRVLHRQVWQAVLNIDGHAKPGLYQELQNSDNEWIHLIEIDVPRTFPENPAFDEAQQRCLLRVLKAYANLCADVGYCQGMNFVAGLLLLVAQGGDFSQPSPEARNCIAMKMSEAEVEESTFWMFFCLMEPLGLMETFGQLNGFYRRGFPLLKRYLWAFDELVAASLPELHEHFCQENLQHSVYLHQWFLTLFVSSLPLPMVLVLWDAIICGGLAEILSISIAVLQLLQQTLLGMRFEEVVSFFQTLKTREQEDCDFESIGRIAVISSGSFSIPKHVADVLRRPLPLTSDHLMERSPQSPTKRMLDSDEDMTTTANTTTVNSPCSTGAASSEGGMLRDYLRQINQGLSWWVDARSSWA